MNAEILISILITAVGALITIIYRETMRRVGRVEKKMTAVLVAVVMLVAREPAQEKLVQALNEALAE